MVSQLAKAHGKFRKCSLLLIIHVKKNHVLNFRCLAESQNFFTIETFENYVVEDSQLLLILVCRLSFFICFDLCFLPYFMDEESSDKVMETEFSSLMVVAEGEVELVPKPDAKSLVWQYFRPKVENGKLIDNSQIYCKMLPKLVDMKWKHFIYGDAFEE